MNERQTLVAQIVNSAVLKHFELCSSFLYVMIALQEDQGIYQNKVRELISDNQYRLIVSVNDLRRKNEKRANR